jgi:hypothetical protein
MVRKIIGATNDPNPPAPLQQTMAIDQLPEEILIHIMTLYRDVHVAGDWNLDDRSKICCPIIYTCRYIYNMAINTPDLWTHVDIKWRAEWLNLCLVRAQSLPLHVSARAWEKEHCISERYAELLARSYYAGINIPYHENVDYPNVIPYMAEPLTHPMPHVRQLVLFGNYDCLYKITPQFMGGSAIQLTSLMLKLVTIGGLTPDFPNLRVLWLGEVTISLSALKALLCITPVLEHLQIDYIFYDEDGLHDHQTIVRLPGGPVHLPKLKTVEMKHSQEALVSIMLLIPLPRCRLGLRSVGESLQEVETELTSIVHEFWRVATGISESRLPSTILRISCIYEVVIDQDDEPADQGWLDYRLELGEHISWLWTETISRTFVEPSIFFSIQTELRNDQPCILTADGAQRLNYIHIMALEDSHIGFKFGTPLLNELLMQVGHLTVSNAYMKYSDEEVERWPSSTREDLEDFLHRIRARSVPLKTLTFQSSHDALKLFGEELRNSGNVEEMRWHEWDSDSEV